MVDAVGPTTYTYTPSGQLLTEDGPWANDTVTYTYHASVPGLRTGYTLQQPTGSWSVTETPDTAKRLASVVSPAGTFNYTYRGAANVWTNLSLPNAAAITNVHDNVGRLTGTYLRTNASMVLNKQLYQYNTGSQRTQLTRSDNSTVTYTYDPIGQLSKALGSGGLSTENLGYGYDTAWNVAKRTNVATVTTFNVNGKNELTSVGSTTFTYDNNGNLSAENPGRGFTYDSENQFVRVGYVVGTYTGAYWQVDFVYDGRGRLRRRISYTWSGSGFVVSGETRYIYDGMRVIQERSSANAPTVAYTRGKDLSGRLEGAGGIGGLLARSDTYSSGSMTRHACYYADGNGNVLNLIDAGAPHTIWAAYKYQPWGTSLQATGILASANVYRFSSKEWVATPGLYYYGYRFYEPNLQRWLNRDPLGDVVNLKRAAKGARTSQKYRLWSESLQPAYTAFLNAPSQVIDTDGRANAIVVIIAVPLVIYGLDVAACYTGVRIDLFRARSLGEDVAPDGSRHHNQGSQADALTHCIAGCLSGQRPGSCLSADRALAFLNDREAPGEPPNQMDAANNAEGSRMGRKCKRPCQEQCLEALNSGQLFGYNETTALPLRVE